MNTAMAVIPLDLTTSSFGLSWDLSREILGRNILAHTLSRVARIENLSGIILIHPVGQDLSPLLAGLDLPLPLHFFAVEPDREDGGLADNLRPMRIAARKPSPASWRGGLGGMSVYDEILAAGPMADALKQHDAEAGVLIGASWLLVDPAITSDVLKIHLDYPEAMQLTFCQAAPGLSGLAISRDLLASFATNGACVGQVLSYNPQRPQADPIGRDVCAQIPATVRDCPYRVIHELPRDNAMIQKLTHSWDAKKFAAANAVEVAQALGDMMTDSSAIQTNQTGESADTNEPAFLPREVTLELTPKRTTVGPLLPQFHVKLNRPDLSLDDAKRVFEQLANDRDTFVVLGGLGDALLHPQWDTFVLAAHDAGVLGICIETDLLVEESVLGRLLELPIDIISVRINADTGGTYRKVMAPDADESTDYFKTCIGNLQKLLNQRNARWQGEQPAVGAKAGLPWIVPSLVKTADTFGDMETFFDRWMVYTSAAVIAPAQTGCGLMPAQSPVHMTPPRRRACRQLARRLTILSDGSVAQCDQDWLSRAAAGNIKEQSLYEMMAALNDARALHAQGKWDELALCSQCDEWHRP